MVIDLHAHVLAGIDDGPRNLEESLELLEQMEAEGVTTVVATPHVRSDFPTTPAQMGAALAELRAAARARNLGIVVEPGGELAIDWIDDASIDDVRAFGLAGNPGLVLVEFPYGDWPYLIETRVRRLRERGITSIIAHPERNEAVVDEPALMAAVVQAGGLVQVTAGSLEGRFGKGPARCAEALLKAGLVHLLASDAHGPHVTRTGLREAAEGLDPALGAWLVQEVPAALLAGRPVPSRPPSPRRAFGLRLPWR